MAQSWQLRLPRGQEDNRGLHYTNLTGTKNKVRILTPKTQQWLLILKLITDAYKLQTGVTATESGV